MIPTLTILRVSRYPSASDNDDLFLDKGVNVLYGEKDSGKSTWLRMIDYALGDDGKPSDLFGKEVAALYDTVEMDVEIGGEVITLQRSWAPSAPKTKMLWNDVSINVADLSNELLNKLGIPRLHFPKGDPFSERAWPTLSFRTLLRHVYRQERFWSDLADKQPETDQHACIALFLGVAEALFPNEYGKLVEKQKRLQELQVKRAAQQELLDQIAADLIAIPDAEKLAVSKKSVDQAEELLRKEIRKTEEQRSQMLNSLVEQQGLLVDQQTRDAQTKLNELAGLATLLKDEAKAHEHRKAELLSYYDMLENETLRFKRTEVASGLMAHLKVTHCPVCDQEVRMTQRTHDCHLCHQPIKSPAHSSAKDRVDFEEHVLSDQKEEIIALISDIQKKIEALKTREVESVREQKVIQELLRPAHQLSIAMLPPDLALIDQRTGQLRQQMDTLQRVRRSVENQELILAEIESLEIAEAELKGELNALRSDVPLEKVSELFEERINHYLDQININDSSRWKHGQVTFQIKERRFNLQAHARLGATSQAILMFAYHYALLSLTDTPGCRYPGLSIIDFPLQLADGATIRDKENYLVEPFVKLCKRKGMSEAQAIFAGHSFLGLKGAKLIPIVRGPIVDAAEGQIMLPI